MKTVAFIAGQMLMSLTDGLILLWKQTHICHGWDALLHFLVPKFLNIKANWKKNVALLRVYLSGTMASDFPHAEVFIICLLRADILLFHDNDRWIVAPPNHTCSLNLVLVTSRVFSCTSMEENSPPD